MANTDTRSGFRLPWSSDRSHENPTGDEAAPAADESVAEADAEAPIAWPSTDFNARLGLNSQPRPADASDADAPPPPVVEEPAMIDLEPSPAPAPVAPHRKPTKLMADLTSAIRATAIAARDQALVQVDADVAQVVETIRSSSKEGEDALRVRSDEDIARIKEWSRAEIARIKEETENRIGARKLGLDEELAAHAAAIEGRVGEVEQTAAAYKAEMEAYSVRLASEEDPASLATLAESMPEPPVLESLGQGGDLAVLEVPTDQVLADGVDALEQTADAVLEADPEVQAEAEAEPQVEAQIEAVAEPEVEVEVEVEAVAEAEIIEPAQGESEAVTEVGSQAVSAWGEPDVWGAPTAVATADAETETETETSLLDVDPDLIGDGSEEWTLDHPVDDVPRWAAGDTPDGFPTSDGESGDPVDRGAIMAALEAAAEAVVAAESAAESADQAEAAADVAETAAELLKGRAGSDDEYDPEAQAALSARMGAGGLEESYTDRLASLMPNHGEGAADGEPRATQVIVSGLVSVASIASFKRHLGRLVGVQAVAVASGPDGEFVFNVTHRPDVSFRDAVPTMPGFAARVTSSGDGVVQVTARDPEAEG